MSGILKKIGIAIVAIIILLCAGVDIWYVFIKENGPAKTATSTYKGGELEKANGEKKNIFEIKYFSNKNKNGLECFELKLTNFLDSTREDTRTIGFQYVAKTKLDELDWYDFDKIEEKINLDSYKDKGDLLLSGFLEYMESHAKYFTSQDFGVTDRWGIFNIGKTYSSAVYFSPYINGDINSQFVYDSINEENFTSSENLKPDKNSKLIIQIGKEQMGIQMKYDSYLTYEECYGDKAILPLVNYQNNSTTKKHLTNFYYSYSYDFLNWYLYEKVKTATPGTQYYNFAFGDIFNYFDYKNNVLTQRHDVDYDLINEEISSYYTVKVEVLDDGIRKASESSFKLLCGSKDYMLDDVVTDYFSGQQIINLDFYAFDVIDIGDNFYKLKLKEDILKAYLPKKNSISFIITIDKSILEKEGRYYNGFSDDSGLDEFKIHSVKIINGTEVD